MALSDEILADPERMTRLRSRLEALARESGARAAFLVDEGGTPFATIGHVEFRLPHPLAGLVEEGDADAILGALVASPRPNGLGPRRERLSARALLSRLSRPPSSGGFAIRASARALRPLNPDSLACAF
jgi:hypothetical protein